MRPRALAAASALALLSPRPALAEPAPRRLELRLPSAARTPQRLAMRSAPEAPAAPAAQAAPPPAATAPAPTAADEVEPAQATAAEVERAVASAVATAPALRRGDESLAFRFDLGFALDGAAASGEPTLAGHPVEPGSLAEVRSYGFGDVFLGSRGLILPNINAFLSASYRIAPSLGAQAPIAEPRGFANDIQIRSGWAELRDVGPRRWSSPLRLRAGRFYIYGPWVTHVDGFTARWDGRAVQASATLGGRVTELTSGTRGGLPMPLLQLTVRGDLTASRRRLPLVAGAELLGMAERIHTRAYAAWQPSAGFGLGATVRALGGALVHEQLTLRARLREVSNVYAELSHRHGDDWRWDPSLATWSDADPGSARRYLELGPVLPRLVAQVRAGTVLFDNIDLLARAATALDLSDALATKSSFSAGYLELGGGLEVRLRRTLAVGAIVTTRTTRRTEVAPVADVIGEPSALPVDGSYGETAFIEAGATARLSLGARTLTFGGELFARRTQFAELYSPTDEDPLPELRTRSTYFGGRASVDAWIGDTLRVLARYEVVSERKLAPEITGFKALRVIAEATF